MQSDNIFTISDDVMFSTVLAAKPDLAKGILEIVLDISIDHVVCVNAQKILNYSLDSKYVRFDVFTKDESGIVNDVEIQTKTKSLSRQLNCRAWKNISVLSKTIVR